MYDSVELVIVEDWFEVEESLQQPLQNLYKMRQSCPREWGITED